MTLPTEMARRTAEVAKAIHPLLRERSFRKRRNAFNREPEPGIVHVISLAMGRYELYGEPHDPFEAHGYGTFSVDYGLYVQEVAERLGLPRDAEFVPEYACEARRSGAAPDSGWYLGEPHEELVAGVREALLGTVLPWLDRFPTRAALLAEWERDPRSVGLTRDRLAIALVHLERGDHERALELVDAHLARANPPHAAWLPEHVLPQLAVD